MKRFRLVLSLLLIGVLAFGAGFGTMAYYTNTFSSNDNTITSAKFEVEAGGEMFAEEFYVDGGNFAPGREGRADFVMDKTGTEVPVGYRISVSTAPNGQEDFLFRAGTPVVLSLVKVVNGVVTVLDSNITSNMPYLYTPLAGEDVLNFGVVYTWPWETAGVDDKEFAGDSGKILLNVEARQLKDGEKYVAVNMRDKRTTPRVDSRTTGSAIVVNGQMTSFTGYDEHFGNFSWNGTSFTTDRYTTGWLYRGINVNGDYQFQQGGGTGPNGELNVEFEY